MNRPPLRIAAVIDPRLAGGPSIEALIDDLGELPGQETSLRRFDRADTCLAAIEDEPFPVVLLEESVGALTALDFVECLTSRGSSTAVIAVSRDDDRRSELWRSSLLAAGAIEALSLKRTTPETLDRAITRATRWWALHESFRHSAANPHSASPSLAHPGDAVEIALHALFHELKTPLTALRELVSLLAEEIPGSVNEEQSELLALCGASCEQLRSIMEGGFDRLPRSCEPGMELSR